MFKTITDPKEMIEWPDLSMEVDLEGKTQELELFGKKYRMYADDWKHHVHLKCTSRCDAACKFCSERPAWGDPEAATAFMHSARSVLVQMKEQKMLRTVSVTGGEPTVFPEIQELVDLANWIEPMLFSMNSNGRRMLEAFRPGSFKGWLDLSKHAVDDRMVFMRNFNVTREEVSWFKYMHPGAKVRLQCVLGAEFGIGDIAGVLGLIRHFSGTVDNFSFRSLIMRGEHDKVPPLFTQFRDLLRRDGKCLEQTIQDYYVYEVYSYGDVEITVSWSNMYLLNKFNESHPGLNFLEEVIVHPDGVVSGSWDKKTLVIHDPRERSGDAPSSDKHDSDKHA